MTDAFPIQTATLPDTLQGRDVLGRGRTGSGKTLAFSLPLVARLAGQVPGTQPVRHVARRPTGLVLAPTRELATQIAATLEPLARAARLSVTTIFGGVSQRPQESALNGGIDIVVACPGRLEDLMKQGVISLADVKITVLDEADHMADLGFLPGVKRILSATPKGGQRLLFSATLDNGVDALVKAFLRDPLRHSVDTAQSPVSAMTHHVLTVPDAEVKRDVVQHLASGTGRRVLFTRTKHAAKKLAKQLTSAGVPAVDLHGNLGQGARERNLEAFSTGAVKVLVATDIAARGIHVDDVELVVHVDPPAEHKAYLHRSGRTARAGSEGAVVTIVLPEQLSDVRSMTRQAGIQATPQPVRPGARVLNDLVPTLAAPVAPSAPAAPVRPAGRGATPGGPAADGQRPAGRSRRRRGKGGGTTSTDASASRGARQPSGAAPRQGGQPARAAAGGAQRSSVGAQRSSAGAQRSSGGAAGAAPASSGARRPAGPRRAGRASGAPAQRGGDQRHGG
ncbi:DEAD/DEAH box helicase [Cellulomonas sp. DKR-3]|uniref:DEAD/DEAH box helicase n=2 Tax=Cellulomonas fulva TaxID=2835530 RepID=A0ABS5TUX4_9CELL|nr:DEAD/DEAH box helicase [Cellulomonas fulva]